MWLPGAEEAGDSNRFLGKLGVAAFHCQRIADGQSDFGNFGNEAVAGRSRSGCGGTRLKLAEARVSTGASRPTASRIPPTLDAGRGRLHRCGSTGAAWR